MLETYLLEQLVAVARTRTLSAAAEELHLSQPALSRSMKKLEDVIGVPLFDRQKNRITLNENGEEAAILAESILKQQNEMIEHLRALDRSRHTIFFGACAPVPTYTLPPLLHRLYPGMAISQDIRGEEELLAALESGELQLAVFHRQPEAADVAWVSYLSEKLFICLPPDNPLAKRTEGLYLADLGGLNVLLYTNIGFWYELCLEKSPDIRFLRQNDWEAFDQLVDGSNLPVFASDYFFRFPVPENFPERVAIPLLDEECSVTYYLACRKDEKKRFRALFEECAKQSGKMKVSGEPLHPEVR